MTYVDTYMDARGMVVVGERAGKFYWMTYCGDGKWYADLADGTCKFYNSLKEAFHAFKTDIA